MRPATEIKAAFSIPGREKAYKSPSAKSNARPARLLRSDEYTGFMKKVTVKL
jgi:hypothetical protein